ncbi:MCE family protein [Actinomadura sp. 21ATH]|uniref:MCE family protein n=1 Tax=Actinomadura sp. 21ATH TaxID=1735444 RepID=UPI0035C0B565
MHRLRDTRILLGGLCVLLAGVLAAAIAVAATVQARQRHRSTVYFDRATGLYPGSDVRVLGIKIGEVTGVRPAGRMVRVDLFRDAGRPIPADAQAVIVSPTMVADRYVQFTPVYRGGPAMRDGAVVPLSRTAVPVELDDALGAVNELARALGPGGANARGSLSRLLRTGARTLGGQGENVHATVERVADALDVLAGNRGNTMATIRDLGAVTRTLAEHDTEVGDFAADLALVSAELRGEKEELGAALRHLSVALRDLAGFVRANKAELGANVGELAEVTGVLARQRRSLETFLEQAPAVADNLNRSYDPVSGTLHGRADIVQADDLARWLCSLTYSPRTSPQRCESLVKPVNALGPVLNGVAVDASLGGALGSHYAMVEPPPDAYPPEPG